MVKSMFSRSIINDIQQILVLDYWHDRLIQFIISSQSVRSELLLVAFGTTSIAKVQIFRKESHRSKKTIKEATTTMQKSN